MTDETNLPAETQMKALRTVCHFADGDKEAAEDVAEMLGLIQRPKAVDDTAGFKGHCRECGKPMGSRKAFASWRGPVYYGGNGMCERDYSASLRKRRTS